MTALDAFDMMVVALLRGADFAPRSPAPGVRYLHIWQFMAVSPVRICCDALHECIDHQRDDR